MAIAASAGGITALIKVLSIPPEFTAAIAISIWNYMVEDLWGLRTDEVLGQSIFSLDIGLPVEQLLTPIRDSLSEKNTFKK